jgi:ribosomal protein L14
VQGRKSVTQKDSQSSTLQSFVGVSFHKETAFRDKIVKSVLEAAKRDAKEHGEVLAATVMATVQGMQR